MKTIAFFLGTRPEYIKIIKVIEKLKECKKIKILIISSNQQNDILNLYIDSRLEIINLGIRKTSGTELFIAELFIKLKKYLINQIVDYFFVQGDTSTTYASCLYGFLNNIKVIHLEAGLRTNDVYSPFPEEFFRQSVSKMSTFHLAQTYTSKKNLIKEGISKNILTVGNPGIDYLLDTLKKNKIKNNVIPNSILITMHRRESLDKDLETFILNLKTFLSKNNNCTIFWPVHPNPRIKNFINKQLDFFKKKNVSLLNPLSYEDFLKLLNKVEMVITDSGGVQEEAAYIGKPLLIARNKTERVDIIKLKLAKIIKADGSKLKSTYKYYKNNRIQKINTNSWRRMQGLGKSSDNVSKFLKTLI